MKQIITFFEKNAFGVCRKIGRRAGISSESIRIYFIYASFLTFGSPLVLYLGLAFWLRIRKHLRRYRLSIRGF